jgi:hypothetical protein
MPETEPDLVTPQDKPATVVANGAKLVGESFIPGASLYLDGDVAPGLAHTVVGLGARALLGALGPLAMVVVAADSYTKSVTDRNLYEHVVGAVKTTRLQPPIASSPSPAAES